MKRIHASLIGLTALGLVVGLGAGDAMAGLRVRATLTTPNVRVHVRNTPASHYRSYTRRHLPPSCEIVYYRPNPRDRAIALRLARYTGVTARELIGMKRRGYTWIEIGCWLDLPRYVVRAARNERTWRRFLHKQRKFSKRKTRGFGHGWNRATFPDGDFMDADDVGLIKANEVYYEDD